MDIADCFINRSTNKLSVEGVFVFRRSCFAKEQLTCVNTFRSDRWAPECYGALRLDSHAAEVSGDPSVQSSGLPGADYRHRADRLPGRAA